MCHGEPIDQVVQIERNVGKLVYLTEINIFTLQQLVSAGITFQELIDANLTIEGLLEHFNIHEMYLNGITITQMLNEGLSFEFLYNEFYSSGSGYPTFIPYFLQEGFLIEDFINIGVTITQLYYQGVTLQQLIDSTIPLKNIISEIDDIYTDDILSFGFSQQTLIDEGIIEETPLDGFYILNYVFGGDNFYGLNMLNETYPNGSSQWRLPTLDELIFIYDNQQYLDLRLDINPGTENYISTDIEVCWDSPGIDYTASRIYVNFDSGNQFYGCSGNVSWVVSNTCLLPVIQL